MDHSTRVIIWHYAHNIFFYDSWLNFSSFFPEYSHFGPSSSSPPPPPPTPICAVKTHIKLAMCHLKSSIRYLTSDTHESKYVCNKCAAAATIIKGFSLPPAGRSPLPWRRIRCWQRGVYGNNSGTPQAYWQDGCLVDRCLIQPVATGYQ